MSPHRRNCLGLLAAAWAGVRAQAAADDPMPPMLTVRGRVALGNQGDIKTFDKATFESLPLHHVTAKTPWYAEPRRFSGPLLREVLARAGATGNRIRAVALNDYRVDIPFDDAQRYDVIVARLLDDKPMSVRDKGPLFIMYPFDSHPQLRNAVYFSRCAWQLKALEVL